MQIRHPRWPARFECADLGLVLEGETDVVEPFAEEEGLLLLLAFGEAAELLASVGDERLRLCTDTCHLFASGYDITESKKALTSVIDEFEKKTGEPPSFFHLNDSDGELGSNRDRHMLIGEGRIGEEPFHWLMRDNRTNGVPLILETPQKNYDIADDDDSPDPYDLRMMELLLS